MEGNRLACTKVQLLDKGTLVLWICLTNKVKLDYFSWHTWHHDWYTSVPHCTVVKKQCLISISFAALCLCSCPGGHPRLDKSSASSFVGGCKEWAKYSVGWKLLKKNFLSIRYCAPDDRRPPGAADPSALSQRVPGRGLHLPGCLQTGLMSHDWATLCDLVCYSDWIGSLYRNLPVDLIATADCTLPLPCFL